jgi:hypothetical protein
MGFDGETGQTGNMTTRLSQHSGRNERARFGDHLIEVA